MRHKLAKALLALFGWQVAGAAPDIPKYVIIAAPHTSNWDLPVMLALAVALRLNVQWMGKHTLFRPPFGWLMRRLGGIPIDRRARHNVVEQAIESFRHSDTLALCVLPEGTRKRTEYWKSGFYHIARGANVPIVLGFADYRRKRGGIGPIVTPTGDIDADMAAIRAFYSGVQGQRPEQFGPVQLKPTERSAERSAGMGSTD